MSEALLAEYLKQQEYNNSYDVIKVRSYMQNLAKRTLPLSSEKLDSNGYQVPPQESYQSIPSNGATSNVIPHQAANKEDDKNRHLSNPKPKASSYTQAVSLFQQKALATSLFWCAAVGMGALFAYAVGKETVIWRRQLR